MIGPVAVERIALLMTADQTCAGCGVGHQAWGRSSRVRCVLCGAVHCAACVETTYREERFWHAGARSEWTCRRCGYVVTQTRWDALD